MIHEGFDSLSDWLSVISVCGVVLFLSMLLSLLLQRAGHDWFGIDSPNDRSLHVKPTPRSGGIAINLSLVVGFGALVISFPLIWCLVPGWLILLVVALKDDVNHVNSAVRLVLHFIAAILFIALLHWAFEKTLGPIVFVLLIVVLVLSTNFYNFMDGIDGFAASMALVGMMSLSGLSWLNGDYDFMLFCLVVAFSASGFLIENWPPAKIFMGDSGSTVLGFLIGGGAIFSGLFTEISWWVPLLIFSPFWVDASVTLLKRGLQGKKVWQAHREHYYQRLVLMGLGHKKTLWVELALMLLCSISAVCGTFLTEQGQLFLISGWVVVYVIILTLFPVLERRHSRL